jgi:MFS superfamily sulfate permease-like transporter
MKTVPFRQKLSSAAPKAASRPDEWPFLQRCSISRAPNDALTLSRIRIEQLSGLTVALALVPDSVAFAFVGGVQPLLGRT